MMERWTVRNVKFNTIGFAKALGVSPIVAKLMVNRSIYELNEAKSFLNSTIDNFHDGKSMKDLSKAVALIKESIENNKKVLIVGDYDVVVLPGGMPGAVNLRDDERVINLLKEFNSKNKIIAAICAGPISLGKAGISEGKNVTCYPGFEEQLGNCNYQKELVVIDRNIITGRGPAAAIPFAFEILKQIAPEKVEEIKKAMLFN